MAELINIAPKVSINEHLGKSLIIGLVPIQDYTCADEVENSLVVSNI
jgi:hypothetical protein